MDDSGTKTAKTGGKYCEHDISIEYTKPSSGSSMNVQWYNGYDNVRSKSYVASDVSITVAKTGTYKISWIAWRSSSSGTMGSNLHVNSSSGSNNTTFTGTYGQCITLTNQHYNQGDVLTLWGTSGSNSRYLYLGNLIIEQTA